MSGAYVGVNCSVDGGFNGCVNGCVNGGFNGGVNGGVSPSQDREGVFLTLRAGKESSGVVNLILQLLSSLGTKEGSRTQRSSGSRECLAAFEGALSNEYLLRKRHAYDSATLLKTSLVGSSCLQYAFTRALAAF
eukprot:IDg11660t1